MIFSNIEILLQIHEQILIKLESVNVLWPSIDGIGEFFIKIVKYIYIFNINEIFRFLL